MHELSECGEVTCAITSNSRTLITGSTNTVINVWQLSKANARCAHVLRLRKSLYGHMDAISTLAVCVVYGFFVSGSRDGTCIVWDLSSLLLIRQLRPHSGPVSAIAVNESTVRLTSLLLNSIIFSRVILHHRLARIYLCGQLMDDCWAPSIRRVMQRQYATIVK